MNKDNIDIEVINEKMRDIATPGYQAEFDPNEAEASGAFAEDALSESDALEAAIEGSGDGE